MKNMKFDRRNCGVKGWADLSVEVILILREHTWIN